MSRIKQEMRFFFFFLILLISIYVCSYYHTVDNPVLYIYTRQLTYIVMIPTGLSPVQSSLLLTYLVCLMLTI